eukprot:2790492-Pleurochrysis_carterae.AAC.4
MVQRLKVRSQGRVTDPDACGCTPGRERRRGCAEQERRAISLTLQRAAQTSRVYPAQAQRSA